MVTDHHLFFLQVLKVCCQRTIWPNRTCFSLQFWTSCVNVVLSSPSMVCFSNHKRCGRGCCICWSRWTSAKLSISAWWVSSVRRPSHCGQGAAVKHSTPYVCLLVSRPAEEASHWRLSGTRRIWRITSSSCVWRLFSPHFTVIVSITSEFQIKYLMFCLHSDLCSDYHQDQDICAAVLQGLLPSVRSLGESHHPPKEMRHVRGSLLQVVSGFWSVLQELSWVQGMLILVISTKTMNWHLQRKGELVSSHSELWVILPPYLCAEENTWGNSSLCWTKLHIWLYKLVSPLITDPFSVSVLFTATWAKLGSVWQPYVWR